MHRGPNHSSPGVVPVTQSPRHRRMGQNFRPSSPKSTPSLCYMQFINKTFRDTFSMLASYPVGHTFCFCFCFVLLAHLSFKKQNCLCLKSGCSLVRSVIFTRCLGKIRVRSQLLPGAHYTQAAPWAGGGQQTEKGWVPSMLSGRRWCLYSGLSARFICKIPTHVLGATQHCSVHTVILRVRSSPFQRGNRGMRDCRNFLRIHVTRKELTKPESMPWKADVGSPCHSIPLAGVQPRNIAGLTGGAREDPPMSAGWGSGLGVQLSLGSATLDAPSCAKTQFPLIMIG